MAGSVDAGLRKQIFDRVPFFPKFLQGGGNFGFREIVVFNPLIDFPGTAIADERIAENQA
jgi:hypothetical protein